MTTKQESSDRTTQARKMLLKYLRPGTTVYTVLKSVSKSGMTRRISLHAIYKGDIVYLSGYAAHLMGYKVDDDGGIKIQGCGMDMGFSLVYNLGRTLWPKGFKLAKNQHGRNGDTSGFDDDGGYALKQRWI